jgi:predicted acyltransferase
MPLSRAVEMDGATAPGRLRSVDIFRGATIAAMILVNAQFSHSESYSQLAHAAWHGWTFADTIFPTFLFIVGVSLTLSTASRRARGQSSPVLMTHALTRALIILCCGLAIDNIRFPAHEFPFVTFQDHLLLPGVLQKIAICYLVAFSIYLWSGLRGVILGIVGLNLLYLGLLYYYPVPGCTSGSLTTSCNFPGYVDQVVLDGYRWGGTAFEPDGVGSLLPATTTVLFGVLAGQIMLRASHPLHRLLWLAIAGLALIAIGELMAVWVPVNKQLWTPSFAVLMAGLSTAGWVCFICLVDGRARQRWLVPLEVLGMNALAAYLISRIAENLPRVHVMGASLYSDVLARIAQPPNASLLYAMVVLGLVFMLVWILDRQHWLLKI